MSRKWGLASATGLLSLSLDLLTKWWVAGSFARGERLELLPGLAIERTANRGVAFGLFSGYDGFIVAAALLALGMVFLYLALERRMVVGGIAGGMLAGGSLGNLAERLISGSVTDFIKLPYWPNFNLADVFIVAGVVVIAASLLLGGWSEGEGAYNRQERLG